MSWKYFSSNGCKSCILHEFCVNRCFHNLIYLETCSLSFSAAKLHPPRATFLRNEITHWKRIHKWEQHTIDRGANPCTNNTEKSEPRRGDRIILLIICRSFGALFYWSYRQGFTPLPVIFQSFGLMRQSYQNNMLLKRFPKSIKDFQ